jgi:hypothetical protein
MDAHICKIHIREYRRALSRCQQWNRTDILEIQHIKTVVMEVWSGPVEFKQFIAGATVEYESMAQFERYDKERAKCLSVVWNRD